MGKFVLFSLNMIFLVAYKFFFGGDVEVKQVFPDEIVAGEKFNVEIIINKGDHEGFAKWQQELPQGLIASSIESEGATFSFKSNTVKLIWMALPNQESFVIKYQIESDPNLSGSFDINGKFSYIEDNERMDVTAATHIITIAGKAEGMTASQAEPKDSSMAEVDEEEMDESAEEMDPEVEVPAVAIAAIDEDTTEEPEEEMEEPVDYSEFAINERVTETKKVKVDRRIKLLGPGKYLVELDIDKDGFRSFGKVEEYIPEGYVASEVESGSGRFSVENNVLKVLWMAMPKSSEIMVSYELQSEGDELDSATVHGVFSFLRGDESVQLAMTGSRFPNTFEAPKQMAQSGDKENEAKSETVEESKPLGSEITSIPSPETEVRYRVQIAAAKKEVGKTYFEQRHGIMDEITIDFHNSWFKYMIGSFGVYKQARDRRNAIWNEDNKIDDAYVCAYNSGERISVQEALMITKQKWYK